MPDLHPNPTLPFPILVQSEDVDSALPLERTLVSVQITGPVASVVVTQRFTNPLKEPAELDYLFPLPEEAAIHGFEVKIGSRRILGDLQEYEAAREAYEEAKGQGKRTGLFEQRRPNLFAVRLANILPGEGIDTTVRYQQRVNYTDGVHEFVYPMGLTPRFDRPERPQEGEGVHAPVALGEGKIGQVEIQVVVDAGLPVGGPLSPSHPLEILRTDDRRFQVRLSGEHIPDHDFILRYPLASAEVTAAGWCSGEEGKEFFLATVVPPRMEDEPVVPPREFIFVLDRSGSMTGEPIAQARNALRACLRSLNQADTFRILLFDNTLEWYTQEAVPVTQEQVERADAFLARVQGRGGTEIIKAIDSVLSLPADPGRTRFVVFLTDGAVSAEGQALEQVRGRIGAARLFTFGVGPSVNRALLSRMARLGRGRSVFLQLDEDIEGAIIQFQDSVSFPVLTGISLRWENGKAWDVYPSRLPDLYSGQPLEISGRLARANGQPARMVLQGDRAGQKVELDLSLNSSAGRDPAIERVWAQARVEDLLEQMAMEPARAQKIRAEIVGLAVEFDLVTPYTSFVAIDQETAQAGGKPRIIHIAQPLPKGLDPSGFMAKGPVMQTMGMITPASFMPQPPSSPSAGSAQAASRPLRSLMSKLGPKMVREEADAVPPVEMRVGSVQESLSTLRWLAREQKLDGSWGDDVEWTAAALLAFVRDGNTTRAGSFRQALRRAVRWLMDHPGIGPAAFVRARALEELAQATGEDRDRSLAQAARLALPAPSTPMERAALGEKVTPPADIRSLEDLRLAVLMQTRQKLPQNLFRGENAERKIADLAATWAAAL